MLFSYLLLLVPLSLVLGYLVPVPPVWVFVTAALAVVPLADRIRRATEELARSLGPAVGGLLNVSFGNLPELILALFVLAAGKPDVVKGQITGAIIGNGLLGLGLAVLVGSWGREKQSLQKEQAGLLSSLLLLATIALLVPALFDYTERGLFRQAHPAALDERLSLCVSVVLIGVYLANLVYTLVTHRDAFASGKQEEPPRWSVWTALAVLVGAAAVFAVEAELISTALEATAEGLGLSSFFLGVVVLAIMGNAAEYVSAVYFAHQDRLDLAMSVTVGSTIQVALLVAPLLVLISYLMGRPMDLVFANPLEMIAIAAVAFVVNSISHDGEATWFEGVLLVAVYLILGLAFYFITP